MSAVIKIGMSAGSVACLEKEIKKKINLIECALHHNELPSRKVFKLVDANQKFLLPSRKVFKLVDANQKFLIKVSGFTRKQISIDFHFNPKGSFFETLK
jgi:hypothetical protein